MTPEPHSIKPNDLKKIRNYLAHSPKNLQNILINEFSPELLETKLESLSDEEKKKLEAIKKKLNIQNNEEIIDYIYKGIGEVVTPKDRAILSDPLMKKISKLEKLSYKLEIQDFENKCSTTDEELYEIIISTLESLWVKKYEKKEAYNRFAIFKNFEQILFKDPRYRDHFIHQFQVFLSGLPIIEEFYDDITSSYSEKFDEDAETNIDFSWLLAATFHDIGYLVQKFDTGLNSFFKEFLDIQDIPINIDIGKLLLERNFQDYIDKLTSLYLTLYNKDTNHWKYDGPHIIDHNIRKFLTAKCINERNHGLISSLILLDRIEHSEVAKGDDNYNDRLFSSVIMPAGLSIALHDSKIFTDSKIPTIEFKNDPLTFILIYCDTIQEWGRPINTASIDDIAYMPQLTDFIVKNNRVCATLTYEKIQEFTQNGKKTTTYDEKVKEIETVLGKLKSKDILFEIKLRSNDDEKQKAGATYSCIQ